MAFATSSCRSASCWTGSARAASRQPSCCCAAIGAVLFGLGDTVTQLTLGRALIGLGVSSCLMASFKANTLFWPPERLAVANGFILAFGGLGATVATLPVEWLLKVTDWRTLFFCLAGADRAVVRLHLVRRARAPRRRVGKPGRAGPCTRRHSRLRQVLARCADHGHRTGGLPRLSGPVDRAVAARRRGTERRSRRGCDVLRGGRHHRRLWHRRRRGGPPDARRHPPRRAADMVGRGLPASSRSRSR